MSQPSPTAKHRVSSLPKRGNAELHSPSSSPLPEKKPPFYPYTPSSPKTPRSLPVHAGEKARTQEMSQVVQDTFGARLQSAHEPINSRHQNELQALECFRGYVHKRAKAEGDYAATLAKIHGHAVREMASLGTDSRIVQVWNGVLEAMETIQKKHYSIAKHVEGTLLCTVDLLMKDKKRMKRAYDISRSQLDDEYHTSCTNVQNLRREYFNLIQVTENTKRKLEDTLKKPNAKPDEIDKLRVKYAKVAQQLHTAHNDYTLSLLNVNCHMKHYNTSMLPLCLNALQEKMELFVRQWKTKMEEYVQTVDISKVYQESCDKILKTLHQLKPEQEYVDFIKENKSDPVDEENYVFDTTLLQARGSPKVEPTKISINNLTHERLVCELAVMEQRLEEHMKEQSEKAKKFEELRGQSAVEGDPDSPIGKAVLLTNLQADLRSLECRIEREKMKLTRVKDDIDEMKGTPAPLFDVLCEGVIVSTDHNTVRDRQDSTSSGDSSGKVIKKKLKGIMTWINQRSRSQSNEGIPLPAESTPDKDVDYGGDDDYETFQTGVENEAWFYSNMERKEAELKCRNTGDYLVRYSSKQNRYILTVSWAGQGRHFIIQEKYNEESKEKEYFFESMTFGTIRALLDFHVNSQTPITMVSGTLVMNPVLKDDKWLVMPDQIKKIQDLGKGAFGEVYEAEFKGQRVAVKACRSTDAVEKDRFFLEIDILKRYDHPNIVKLIGYCWIPEPLIVMELMPGGSLLKYLKKRGSNLSNGKLVRMSIDACCGMKYLETKSCIHRDLAARNCLVGENDIVKISDFGMSHDECESYQIQSTRQIPIKWTAPETLNCGLYTLASDVWSYGVLLWEIFSGGSPPYPGMSNIEAKNKVDNGYRMPPPTGCPKAVYDVMMLCWQCEPQDRPNFSDLHDILVHLEEP